MKIRRRHNDLLHLTESIRKMKTLLKLILILVLACIKVKSISQGTNVEKGNSQASDVLFLNQHLNASHSIQKIKEEIPQLLKNISSIHWKRPLNFQLFNRSGLFGDGGFSVLSFYNTLLSGVHSLYQDLLNRQQAFINLLTCGNCVNEGWDAIMDVVLNVPELDWVYKPSDAYPSTFFTAVHQNGTVTGIGGSIINDKPVAEYAFGNDGIVQHLPKKHKSQSNKIP